MNMTGKCHQNASFSKEKQFFEDYHIGSWMANVFFLAEALKVKKSMELLVLVENTWGTLIFKIYFFTLKVPVLL